MLLFSAGNIDHSVHSAFCYVFSVIRSMFSVLVVVRCYSRWVRSLCLSFTRVDVGWSSDSGASAMLALD